MTQKLKFIGGLPVRPRNTTKQETVPCRICGNNTLHLGTKLCDRCWELERRIQADPLIAYQIIKSLLPKKHQDDRCKGSTGHYGCSCE